MLASALQLRWPTICLMVAVAWSYQKVDIRLFCSSLWLLDPR